MLADFIKFYFLFFYTEYTALKTLNLKMNKKSHYLISSIFIFFISIVTCILKESFHRLIYLFPLLILWIYIGILSSRPKESFVATILSFGINFGVLSVSSTLALLIVSPFYFATSIPLFLSLAILNAFFEGIFIVNIFKLKRFKNGIPFLISSNTLHYSTSIGVILILYLMYSPNENADTKSQLISLFLFISVLFLLIHWWQTQITKSYKQALINRELESLRMELTEKEKQLAELSARNEELGRLIHKDNKRIPAMEHAVNEFLIMDLDDKETVIERGNTLLLEIQKLSADRNAIVTEIYARKYQHHDTGITELDTMLNYMEKRAYGEHIKLSVQTAVNLRDLVPNTISAEDLSHVLSDLLENAIIATKGHTAPIIQLQFYRTGKDFILEIADNGTPFEATSLVNFGLEQITTHADTGGSGIGLMDIWKSKEKYSASLHISEYDSNAPYTKKIALIFNKKNRYTISTPRKEELSTLCKRTDLQIF